LPTATQAPSAGHETDVRSPLHGFCAASGGRGATEADHEPDEYVSIRGKRFEALSDTEPTATQDVDDEQAVDRRVVVMGD
jgi:hypothetical protein